MKSLKLNALYKPYCYEITQIPYINYAEHKDQVVAEVKRRALKYLKKTFLYSFVVLFGSVK